MLDPHRVEELLERAVRIRPRAYCPYSGFAVGASVLTDDGRFFEGVNVENAALGPTICAERAAVACAVAAGARKLVACAVVGGPREADPRAIRPCGTCRQVLHELGGGELMVYTVGVAGRRLAELLPQAFDGGCL